MVALLSIVQVVVHKPDIVISLHLCGFVSTLQPVNVRHRCHRPVGRVAAILIPVNAARLNQFDDFLDFLHVPMHMSIFEVVAK